MANSRWINKDYKNFKAGDIICNIDKQDFLRLVIKVDETGLWCVGFVHAALTENNDIHPVFYMPFTEIDAGYWDDLMKLGNLKDYMEYMNRVENECIYTPDEK